LKCEKVLKWMCRCANCRCADEAAALLLAISNTVAMNYGVLTMNTAMSQISNLSSHISSKNPIFAHDKIHDRVWNCQLRLGQNKIYRRN
jgi:hypothetical protein